MVVVGHGGGGGSEGGRLIVIRLSLGKLLVNLCKWSNGLIPY